MSLTLGLTYRAASITNIVSTIITANTVHIPRIRTTTAAGRPVKLRHRLPCTSGSALTSLSKVQMASITNHITEGGRIVTVKASHPRNTSHGRRAGVTAANITAGRARPPLRGTSTTRNMRGIPRYPHLYCYPNQATASRVTPPSRARVRVSLHTRSRPRSL